MPDYLLNYRYQNTYIIGQPGTGKTELLTNFIIGAISRWEGLLYFDFNGDGIDNLLPYITRTKDTVLIDPHYPTPFNLFENVNDPSFTAMAILRFLRDLAQFSKNDSTYVFNQFILYASHALIDTKEPTLMDMKYFLVKHDIQDKIMELCRDGITKDFWENDTKLMKDIGEKKQSVLNKLNFMLADRHIRRVISYPHSVIDFVEARRSKKIILVRLPVSEFGTDAARALALIILTKFFTDIAHTDVPFHIYIDDADHMQGQTLTDLLATSRKHNVSVTLAHQYLDQLTREMQMAVFGSTGTKIAFRTSPGDAKLLEATLPKNNNTWPLDRLPQFKVSFISPASADPDKFTTLPVSARRQDWVPNEIKRLAKQRYRLSRNTVDKHIEKVRSGE